MSNETTDTRSRVDRMTDMLSEAGYRQQWSQTIRDTRSTLHCWTGERGVLLVQVWENNHGVSVYSDSGIPVKWDDFAAWLKGAPR